ncbi:MAG: PASTA domain-containing protein [Marinirhabdus sp.]
MSFLKFLFSKIFLKQLLYAVLAIIVLSFLILWWLRITTNHGQKIEVPDLAKLSLDKVEEVLDSAGLRYEIMDSANYNPGYPRYSVIEQIPKSGESVKENRKIYLYLNPSGYRKIPIPHVLQKTLRQAQPTLLASGFKIGKIATVPHVSDQVQELRYKGEKVQPGHMLQKTAAIDLIVGDGSRNRVLFQQTEDSTQEETPDNG